MRDPTHESRATPIAQSRFSDDSLNGSLASSTIGNHNDGSSNTSHHSMSRSNNTGLVPGPSIHLPSSSFANSQTHQQTSFSSSQSFSSPPSVLPQHFPTHSHSLVYPASAPISSSAHATYSLEDDDDDDDVAFDMDVDPSSSSSSSRDPQPYMRLMPESPLASPSSKHSLLASASSADQMLLARIRTLLEAQLQATISSPCSPSAGPNPSSPSADSAMHIKYLELAVRALNTLDASSNNRTVTVIAGIPGSGKSTLVENVARILNEAFAEAAASMPPSPQPGLAVGWPSTGLTSPGLSAGSAGALPRTPRKSFSMAAASGETAAAAAAAAAVARMAAPFAATVGMDGYHLTRKQLDGFPDPAEAHKRRGSPWTFDAHGVVDMAKALAASRLPKLQSPCAFSESDYFSAHNTSSPIGISSARTVPGGTSLQSSAARAAASASGGGSIAPRSGVMSPATTPTPAPLAFAHAPPSNRPFLLPTTPKEDSASSHQHLYQLPPTLHFPSFDHAVKDPTPNGIAVHPATRIVLVEGLYLLYNQPPWCEIADLADDTWMVAVDIDVATRRLAQRHLAAGIVPTLEDGVLRVKTNDQLNARLIMASHVPPKMWIQSI